MGFSSLNGIVVVELAKGIRLVALTLAHKVGVWSNTR
jgi:hypothetical protein